MALDYLRMQNIMGGANMGGSINEDPFNTAPQRPAPFDVMGGASMMPSPVQTQNSVFDSQKRNGIHPDTDQAMMRLKSILDSYQPDTTSVDRNNRLLDSAPEINNPSAMRRFAAMGQSIGNVDSHFRRTGGGPDAADRVLYAPYLQQMADWKEKTGPFATAAANENQRNIQERTLTSNVLSAQMQADKLAEAGRQADEKSATANKDAETRRIAAEAKADNDRQRTLIAQAVANGAKMYNVNGHAIAFYPATGQKADLGEYLNSTAIKLEEMRDATAENVATTRAGATTGAATIRAGATTDAANIRAGAAGAGKGLMPAQVTTDTLNKVGNILAYAPELKKYITIVGRTITMTPPKDGMIFAADPELKQAYDKARSIIYPTNPMAGKTLTGVNQGTFGDNIPDASAQPKIQFDPNDPTKMEKRKVYPDGKIEYSHDGGKTWGVK